MTSTLFRALPGSALAVLAATVVALAVGCGGSDGTGPTPSVQAASIAITESSFELERGFHRALSAVARDKDGAILTIPVVWRSSDERVATVDVNGRITALDTGVVGITASTLGATSTPIGVRVVWYGAAKVAPYQYTGPSAATPGSTVGDSVRVIVTSRSGAPVPGARVAFAGTAGGSTTSPAIAVTNANGVAAAQWTLGPSNGLNAITASVLADDDKPLPFVEANPARFSVTTFDVFDAISGDRQGGTILSPLGVAPSVRVLDANGQPQPGVRVTFTPSAEGRVATPAVSTGADGVASPGVWTLGDTPGDQTLVVKVESATLTLHATATGSPLLLPALHVSASDSASCAINLDSTASCWGIEPKVGDGSTAKQRNVPIPTSGGVHFTSLQGSQTHFCGVATDQAIYCWGRYSFPTATTVDVNVPTRLAGIALWSQVAPGATHNCARDVNNAAQCWGANSSGQLGDGTTTDRFQPAPVLGNFQFTSIVSGAAHSCGLTADGSAYCWGFNAGGQLGDGTRTNASTPTAVKSGTSEKLLFKSLGAGGAYTCGLTTTGRLYCWGVLPGTVAPQSTPQPYAAAPDFASLAAGRAHACALTSDGTAYCWGANDAGQLGDSTIVDHSAPAPVAGTLKFTELAAGFRHTCARTIGPDADTDRTVACWGSNDVGELGVNTIKGRLVPRRLVLGIK